MLLPSFVVGVASGFPIFFSLFYAFFVIVILSLLRLLSAVKRGGDRNRRAGGRPIISPLFFYLTT